MAMTGTGRIEEKTRCLDGIAGDDNSPGPLEMFLPLAIQINDAINPAIFAQSDPRSHRVSTDFRSMRNGVRDMRNQCAGFCADLTSLKTKAAIDAMRPIPVGRGKNGDRTAGDGANAELRAAAY